MRFIGRSDYLEKLNRLWSKERSSLVVVSGRRRIGKSTLIEEFARRSGCDFVEIVGLPPDKTMTNQRQIDNFCERLAKVTGTPEAKADCWAKAFDALSAAVSPRRKTIVFLDEISWMGRYDDAFAGFLKNAWDTLFANRDRLIFVVAGSVSAWIQKNIQKSRAYVGRVSLDIVLGELPVGECLGFWGKKADRVSTREILDILSVTGGVPKYLAEIDPSLSADENIRRLCFDPDGYLFGDFDRIFDDVFDEGVAAKKRIVMALADGPASVKELAERMGGASNGHISNDLSDLVTAGFVHGTRGKNPETGGEVREMRYRLKDNYSRFYLKYVLPRKEAIREGVFRFVSLERLPGWDVVMGLQFENLVLNNFPALARIVGLMGRSVESVAPYYRRKGKSGDGVQIDMLIQLPKSVYVVEVKRKAKITASIESEVRTKLDRLPTVRGKSIRTVLVYDGELSHELEEDGFFDFIVSGDDLLSRT